MNARLAGGRMGRFQSFSGNAGAVRQHSLKKMLHSALPEANLIYLIDDRVTPVNNTTYAVTPVKGRFASGRAEEPGSFAQKNKMFHAAAGEAGVQVWHQDGTGSTA